MKDPNLMRQMMNGQMPDMNTLMNNPNILRIAQQMQMGGGFGMGGNPFSNLNMPFQQPPPNFNQNQPSQQLPKQTKPLSEMTEEELIEEALRLSKEEEEECI